MGQECFPGAKYWESIVKIVSAVDKKYIRKSLIRDKLGKYN